MTLEVRQRQWMYDISRILVVNCIRSNDIYNRHDDSSRHTDLDESTSCPSRGKDNDAFKSFTSTSTYG